MTKVEFKLKEVTQEFVNLRVAESYPHLEEFVMGEYYVDVSWPDGYSEYYGSYKTKKEANAMISSAKKSKWHTFVDKVKEV